MDLDKSIYIYIYSIYIPGYIPGYIYKIYVPGYIYLGYIYHLYIRYIPGHIYQDIYIWGFSPNKNTLEPLRDGINLSIKVPKGVLIWHSTVPRYLNLGTGSMLYMYFLNKGIPYIQTFRPKMRFRSRKFTAAARARRFRIEFELLHV